MEENIKEKSANKQQRSFFCRKIQIPIFGVLIIVVFISLVTYGFISVNNRLKTLEEKMPIENVSTTKSHEMTAERTKRSTGPTKMEIILKKLNKMEERCNQSYHSVARQPVFVLRSLPGKPGRDGVPGRNGKPGRDGAQGQGVPGFAGKPGQDGVPGRDGAQGQGVPGLPGGDGVPGRDGTQGQGVPGLAGKPGQDGVPGRDGAQGQGVPGLAGKPGQDGIPGKDGAQGQGVPGLPGGDGVPGRDGAQGQGVPGLAGKPGQDGVPGKDGAQGQGVPGDQGTPGHQGPQGIWGEKGQRGNPGRGNPGVSGVKGSQGISGQKGQRGNPGVSGVKGSQGISGQKGEQGNPGVSGVSYIRWGKKTCPTTGAKLVYEGYVGGSHYTQSGGGSNYVCLSRNPTYEKYQDGHQNYRSLIYGAEYEGGAIGIFPSSLYEHDVPCVRCHVGTRATQMMIPGRNVCPAGWTREYKGYLMAEYHGHHRTMFTCVDENPDYVAGTHADLNGALFYHAEGICGSLPCKPYVNGRELTCAVCTR